MTELIGPISQVGFPIVVALLLLVRIESKMEKLSGKIEDLSDTILKLTTIIEERGKRKI